MAKTTKECDVFALGVSIGVLLAAYVFLLGVAAWFFNWGSVLVSALGTLYIGYKATLIGSLIGALWAFIDGFIAGVVIAFVYNYFRK